MVSTIANMIIQRGPANVDHTKLTPQLRAKVFEEAGETLQKGGRHDDAALAFSIAGSPKLKETCEYYAKGALFNYAAAYALHLDDNVQIEEIAAENLRVGNTTEARRLYEKTGNLMMIAFIDENFQK